MAGDTTSLEHIVYFCRNIFTLTVKNDPQKNESAVDIRQHKFSSRTNAFSVANQQTCFIARGRLRLASLEVCLDRRLGLYKLNILFISHRNFTICSIDATSKFKTVAKYDLSNVADDFKSVRKFFILESKTVCFNLEADRVVLLHDGSVRTYSAEFHFIVLDCRAVENFLVLIGTTSENGVSLVTLYTSLCSHEKLLKCGSRLIPDFYASVVTCVRIVDLDLDIDADSNDPQFRGSALACTSYGQLIECRNGQLCGCAALPFSDGCDIRLVNSSSNQFDRSLVVVLSSARSCCVVDLKTSQVVFTLEDVGSVLVGDLVGRGTDQILFLPWEARHQSNTDVVSMVDETCDRDLNNSAFLLTDLAGLHIDKWTSVQDCEEPSKNKSTASRQGAIEALDSRLLAGRAMVNEIRRSCLRKLTVVEETAEALRKMTLGGTLVPRSRNTLVPLTGNQIHGNQSCKSPITRVTEAESVTTGSLWQRVVDRKLVIGVRVHNATDSSIHSVELLLNSASITKELITCSRCLRVEPSPLTDARPAKRPKNESSDLGRYISSSIIEEMESIPAKGNGCVLVSCDLPVFQADSSVTFKVVLAWRKAEGSSGNASHPQMIRLSKAVGEVSVDVENVVKGMWNVAFGGHCVEGKSTDVEKDAVAMETASTDLLSLHSIQMGLRLKMSSADVAFPRRLLMLLRGAHLGFAYVDCHESFICTIDNHPLFLARLRILRICYDDVVVEVFVRDAAQWSILLQSLFSLLPSDVTVAVDTTSGSAVPLAESVVLALRQELLVTDRREPASSFADSRETDESRRDVADVRQDFELRRRKFLDRTLTGVDASHDEGYPLKVIELKETTDRLMVSLAQLIGNG